MPKHRLDETDLRMLDVLQREGRITNAELASRVNLSPAPCLRRLQRLESDGIITGYGARVDPRQLGLGLQAFVRIQLEKHDARTIERFGQRVMGWSEVIACFALTGDLDYLLHVYVADLDDFARFMNKVFGAGVVADVNSSFVLNTVKQSHGLPIPRRIATE
jgi:Lrp/AsnC family transcriptional regulator, leucine-responsive regulatory protein